MAETLDIMRHGYPCIREHCWLGKTEQCGRINRKWVDECEYDLRGQSFNHRPRTREDDVEELRAYQLAKKLEAKKNPPPARPKRRRCK